MGTLVDSQRSLPRTDALGALLVDFLSFETESYTSQADSQLPL